MIMMTPNWLLGHWATDDHDPVITWVTWDDSYDGELKLDMNLNLKFYLGNNLPRADLQAVTGGTAAHSLGLVVKQLASLGIPYLHHIAGLVENLDLSVSLSPGVKQID